MRTTLSRVAALGLLAACAGDATPKATPDSTASAAAAVSAEPPVVTITAKDFSYELPDTIQAGLMTLKLVNQGPDLHHVQLLHLGDGKTYAEFADALKAMKPGTPLPTWAHELAGPNTPVPGAEQSLITSLEPGNYVVICFIPGADHVPHAMKGMMKSLTVVPNSGAVAAAPTADITVKMTDYAWEVTPAIAAGKHLIKLENAAEQAHEMFIAQLAPGKTAMDLAKWIENQQGPPPGKPMGGISGMLKGGVVYLPVDLPAGEYGLFCFLPDKKDGKLHIEHGMIKQITVQ